MLDICLYLSMITPYEQAISDIRIRPTYRSSDKYDSSLGGQTDRQAPSIRSALF